MTYRVDDNVFPATAVVYVEARWGSVWKSGSGVIVGKNDILTASHVLYDHKLGGNPDYVRLSASYNPSKSDNIFYEPKYFEYFTDFDPDSDGRFATEDGNEYTFGGSEFDIALISMSVPIGEYYGLFAIDWGFDSGVVNVMGHPGVYGRHNMYDSGSVSKIGVDDVFDIKNLEINPGNSGGPVYYDYGNGPFVIGIVSTGIAATSIGGHRYWLEDALTANNHLINVILARDAVFRFFNASTGAHFYTKSEHEKNVIMADKSSTFRFEGISFTTSATSSDGDEVFRFFNFKTGVHFFTIDTAERDHIAKNLPDFAFEGIAYFAFKNEAADRQGLHRFYNIEKGTHFYTASDAEKLHVLENLPGFRYEGIGFYVDIA